MNNKQAQVIKGSCYPFGISSHEGQLNFSVAAKGAAQVTLLLIERSTGKMAASLQLDPHLHKTGDIWHIGVFLPENRGDLLYYYLIDGRPLLDPYAKSVHTAIDWGADPIKSPPESKLPYFPYGEAIPAAEFDFSQDVPPRLALADLIIYEMHVRGFTQDASSGVSHPGKFLGVIEKIPHLLELGVNAIELLPIQEFDECEYAWQHPHSSHKLYNYWGYSTVNFFSLMNRYACSEEAHAAIAEFKTMVWELHRNGIELILDIVFNHTSEGGETGVAYSFKGFDPQAYYMIDQKGHYLNFSGCGNTFNANHPISMQLILDALRYWVEEMHVDGFRFDLASIFNRGVDGTPLGISALVEAIAQDPCLSQVKLIAEPWDAAGFYQVGAFAQKSSRWSEWNDKYRDGVRRFIKGTVGSLTDFSKRICGSEDLYHGRAPQASINFVTAHDGFTLADLVSYNSKHNLANGENNRDGSDANESWNCGAEGETQEEAILALRERQIRNFHMAHMLSQGVPMLLMGDEYGHTKQGNNNTWCQDNALNWFLWDQLEKNSAFYRFYRLMIQFRKRHSLLRRTSFLTDHDIEWHGIEPCQPRWNSSETFIAFTLKSRETDQCLYAAFNAQGHEVALHIPSPPKFKTWRWIANSANPPPQDFYENGDGPLQISRHFKMPPYSATLLKAV